jgi:hypothetical protein
MFRLFKRFKRWQETRRLARTARLALADPQASIASIIAGQAILIGISERKPICRHCFRMYDPKPHSFAEMFQVRSILMIPDRELDPMLCEDCFANVPAVYNSQATNIGTSNSGHANLVLKRLGDPSNP